MSRHESGRLDGPLTVTDDLTLSGMATDTITVLSGGSLRLSGMASQGLNVHPGGRAHVSGMLRGTLTCGGEVELTGMLDGRIVLEMGGRLLVAEGAGRRTSHRPDLVMGPQGRWQARDRDTYVIDEDTPRWPVESD
jgi:hypothetical protein